MEADVSGAPARPARRLDALEVVGNEADAVAIEQREDLIVVPAGVAELDDMLEVAGQLLEEIPEPLEVFVEARRQLVEDRAERRLEPAGEGDEIVDFRLAPGELLHVGQETVGLDRIAKARRRFLAPAVEGRGQGQAVEAGVDLDRAEFLGIAFEPTLLRQAFGIEQPAPVPVHPARAADVNSRGNS